MSIQITNVKAVMKGSLLASININLPKWGNFIIKGITIFEVPGKPRWISMPSEQFEKDGKKKYSWHCGYEDMEMRKKFEAEVLKAFDEYVKQHPLTPPQPKQMSYSNAPQQPSFGQQNDDLWY